MIDINQLLGDLDALQAIDRLAREAVAQFKATHPEANGRVYADLDVADTELTISAKGLTSFSVTVEGSDESDIELQHYVETYLSENSYQNLCFVTVKTEAW